MANLFWAGYRFLCSVFTRRRGILIKQATRRPRSAHVHFSPSTKGPASVRAKMANARKQALRERGIISLEDRQNMSISELVESVKASNAWDAKKRERSEPTVRPIPDDQPMPQCLTLEESQDPKMPKLRTKRSALSMGSFGLPEDGDESDSSSSSDSDSDSLDTSVNPANLVNSIPPVGADSPGTSSTLANAVMPSNPEQSQL